jgi:hypothetical protein
MILANGCNPLALASSSPIISKAAAPSFIFAEFAGVIVPDYPKDGFSTGN